MRCYGRRIYECYARQRARALTRICLGRQADAAESGAVRADMNCSEYDDDSLYTAIACSEFDASSCQLFCTGNFWCDDLCGAPRRPPPTISAFVSFLKHSREYLVGSSLE